MSYKMRHKKFLNYLLGATLTLSILLAVYLGAFFYQLYYPVCRAELWVQKAQTIKRNLATSISGRKLLIVAGSNGLFGIDSSLLEKSLSIPTVNLSIHAGLGLQYILNEAKMYAKPGDIILLLLEYELLSNSSKPSTMYLNHILELDTPYFNSLSWLGKLQTALAFGVQETWNGFWTKLNHKPEQKNCYQFMETNYQKRKGCYSGVTIDSHGDEKCNLQEAITDTVIKRLDDDTKIARRWSLTTDTKARLANFIQWTKNNDIKLIAGFPSVVDMGAYRQRKTQAFLTALTTFYQKKQVPLLGEPEDFMYDKSNFFDTSYHLHDLARKLRTQQLIELLASLISSRPSSKE